jgi:hypothetical protein
VAPWTPDKPPGFPTQFPWLSITAEPPTNSPLFTVIAGARMGPVIDNPPAAEMLPWESTKNFC